MRNANEPAHAQVAYTYEDEDGCRRYVINGGLTKREYFAAMAMQSLIGDACRGQFELVARISAQYADSLLAELEGRC